MGGECWEGEDGIKSWHTDLRCVGKATTVYKDLRTGCNTHNKDEGDGDTGAGSESGSGLGRGRGLAPPALPCKNDSAMWDSYNTYSNGHGGCCAPWSGDASPHGPMGNYFCGNSSAGGWVGYVREKTRIPHSLLDRMVYVQCLF